MQTQNTNNVTSLELSTQQIFTHMLQNYFQSSLALVAVSDVAASALTDHLTNPHSSLSDNLGRAENDISTFGITLPADMTNDISNSLTNSSSSSINSSLNNCVTDSSCNLYFLKGSLSGLGNNVQLKLKLNAQSRYWTLTGNGSFALPIYLRPEASYVVGIDAQPSGQTCSVSNESGSLSSVSMAYVTLTCSNNSVNTPITPITHTVTALIDSHISSISLNSATVNNGSAQSLTVTAATGYVIKTSSVGGTCPAGSWSGDTYTTGSITADCSVSFSALSSSTQLYVVDANTNTNGFNSFSFVVPSTAGVDCSSSGNVHIHVTSAYGLIPAYASEGDKGDFTLSTTSSNGIQFSCNVSAPDANDNVTVTFSNFRPVADQFDVILGTYPAFHVNLSVNTSSITTAKMQLLSRGAQTDMNLSANFPGCGQKGTVLQRVYDCSKLVKNWGAKVTKGLGLNDQSQETCDPLNGGSCSSPYYTNFVTTGTQDTTNASNYWFVVSCPAGNDSTLTNNGFTAGSIPQQTCSWLTPVVSSTDPALDATISSPTTFNSATQTFVYNTNTNQINDAQAYQPRLLFSGLMDNWSSSGNAQGYCFDPDSCTNPALPGANGFNISSAFRYNSGVGTVSVVGMDPSADGNSICKAAVANTVDNHIRDTVSPSNSDAGVLWQVPSYPMLAILTGGSSVGGSSPGYFNLCTSQGSGNTLNQLCDYKSPTLAGFSAVNLPGFAKSSTVPSYPNVQDFLWSSSVHGPGLSGYTFAPFNGGFGGFTDYLNPNNQLGVRCVSPAWY